MGPTAADGVKGWAAVFFESDWTGEELTKRAQADYDAVMKGSYNQVFEADVPSAPLHALIVAPGSGRLITRETIIAANHALYQIGVFNQLVRQQTAFWRSHLHEIADPDLPKKRREVIASAARAQSKMLHENGIGAAGVAGGWFTNLIHSLDENIAFLTAESRRWWQRPAIYFASFLVAATVGLAIWRGIERATDDSHPPAIPATTTSG